MSLDRTLHNQELKNDANLRRSLAYHIAVADTNTRAGIDSTPLPQSVAAALGSDDVFSQRAQHDALDWIERQFIVGSEAKELAAKDGAMSAVLSIDARHAQAPVAAIDAHLSVGERNSGVECIDVDAIIALQSVFSSLVETDHGQ